MKCITLLFFACLLQMISVAAQERQFVTVKAGQKVKDNFTQSEQYKYPAFTQGKIVFKDGKSVVTKLNYCILVGEMQFVSGKDTLAVDNEKTIDYVQIMQDTFYYDKVFVEKLAGNEKVMMALMQNVKLTNVQKEGAMGTRSSSNGAESYKGTYSRGRFSNWVVQEDMIFSKQEDFYIGNPKVGFSLYKKGNVLSMFPNQKDKIEIFIRDHHTNFKSKVDLQALTDYLMKLN